jgi:primosomal replication protein N
VNLLTLSARIVEAKPLRYTPAGVPVIDLQLEHESMQTEQGNQRVVKAVVQAVAFGAVAERLQLQDTGSEWRFQGFVANPRQGRQVVLHVQEFFNSNESN